MSFIKILFFYDHYSGKYWREIGNFRGHAKWQTDFSLEPITPYLPRLPRTRKEPMGPRIPWGQLQWWVPTKKVNDHWVEDKAERKAVLVSGPPSLGKLSFHEGISFPMSKKATQTLSLVRLSKGCAGSALPGPARIRLTFQDVNMTRAGENS